MAGTQKELEQIKRENPLAYNSIMLRQDEANRQTRIAGEIRTLYPGHAECVVIKMKSGQMLRVGFDLALATLMRGDAELVTPAAVRESAMLRGGESRGVSFLG